MGGSRFMAVEKKHSGLVKVAKRTLRHGPRVHSWRPNIPVPHVILFKRIGERYIDETKHRLGLRPG